MILAAGEGSRLGRPSKPLTRVAGVTLLERAVSAAREVGVGRVVVVIGHAKEDVARFATECGLDVEMIENDGFRPATAARPWSARNSRANGSC